MHISFTSLNSSFCLWELISLQCAASLHLGWVFLGVFVYAHDWKVCKSVDHETKVVFIHIV